MPRSRIGLWLIGAKGGVATTAMTGLAALARNAIEPVGMVTALDPFTHLDLVGFDEIVVGGHDIRPGRLADEARRMWTESRAILPEQLDAAADFFAETEARLRPGTVVAAGDKIRELADSSIIALVETPRQAIDRVRGDIEAFAAAEQLRHVVVVNVASTEPPASLPIPHDFAELVPLLDDPVACPLPASSLYALAAFEAGASYINFTPSTGATPEALQQAARTRHPRLPTADTRFDRIHQEPRRLEDRLGPRPLPRLPRHPDDVSIHLAGLRLYSGRTARARSCATRRTRPPRWRIRPAALACLLLQEPAGGR